MPPKKHVFSYSRLEKTLGRPVAISFKITSETGLFIPNIDEITIKADNIVEDDDKVEKLIKEGDLGVIVQDAYNEENKDGTMLIETFNNDGEVSFYLDSLGIKQVQPYLPEQSKQEQIASFTKNKTKENNLPKIQTINREEVISSYFSLTMVILSSLIVLGTILTLFVNFI